MRRYCQPATHSLLLSLLLEFYRIIREYNSIVLDIPCDAFIVYLAFDSRSRDNHRRGPQLRTLIVEVPQLWTLIVEVPQLSALNSPSVVNR